MARFGEIGVPAPPPQLLGQLRPLNRAPPGLGSYARVILGFHGQFPNWMLYSDALIKAGVHRSWLKLIGVWAAPNWRAPKKTGPKAH